MRPLQEFEKPEMWGIAKGYDQIGGDWVVTPDATAQRILDSMRASEAWFDERDVHAPLVVQWSTSVQLEGDWIVLTENGEQVNGHGQMLADMPTGYHRLYLEGDVERSLIICPNSCPSFEDTWQWGWALQLYALRSKASWGIGDFADLAAFGRLAASLGAHVALLNPLHAPLIGIPQESSPYFPSSREFRNPLYISIEHVPGANVLVDDLEDLVAKGRALNEDRRIDRSAIWDYKLAALEKIWLHTEPSPAFAVYRKLAGVALERYATYCAIAEVHGRVWVNWPSSLKDPASSDVLRFAEEHHDRVMFHTWLQWLLDVQLNNAADELSLIQDLAVGVDPAGADAWLWQDLLALDMRIGAPPDYCNLSGQDWGAPPMDPWRLRAAGYEPFIRTIRANLRRNGGIRIDHVMGLFRLFWIPSGLHPRDGAYVNYHWRDQLGIVALEAQRAGARVIGEDLGTVEDYMREELANRSIATYKLAWFEPESPACYPHTAFAAATTHDLPTVAGVWTGADVRIQEEIGLIADREMNTGIRERVSDSAGVSLDENVEAFADGVHELLANSSAAIVGATVEDAVGVEARPNYPGTTSEYPNWSISLPVTLDELGKNDRFLKTAKILRQGRLRKRHAEDEPGVAP